MSKDIYFQPDFQGDGTLITPDGLELWSSFVYASLDNARKDFPDRPILAYQENDIEDPFFVDKTEEVIREKLSDIINVLSESSINKEERSMKEKLEQIVNDLDRLTEEIGSLRFKERLEQIKTEIKEESKTVAPDWEAIADGRFLVGCSDASHKTAQRFANRGFLKIFQGHNPSRIYLYKTGYDYKVEDIDYKYIAFPRLPGIRQPGLGERPEWLIDTDKVMVKFDYDEVYTPMAFSVSIIADWSRVEEFILLP